MTPHEAEAVALMRRRCPKDPGDWAPLGRDPAIGVWYDWADPATGKVGQACASAAGWHQDPRGERPVLLVYRRAFRVVRRTEEVVDFPPLA